MIDRPEDERWVMEHKDFLPNLNGEPGYRVNYWRRGSSVDVERFYDFESESDAAIFILVNVREGCQVDIPDWSWIGGMGYRRSRYYHGRHECHFYGRRGLEIRTWILDQFGPEDDMIYASNDDSEHGYQAMLSGEQLTTVLLKFG